MPRSAVTITLPAELIEVIDSKAEISGKNRSQMIEELVKQSLAPSDELSGFHESAHIAGDTETVLAIIRGMLDPNGGHRFDLDRRRIVKFYTEVKPGETPYGHLRAGKLKPTKRKNR